jgi:hypothetical protein
LPDAVGTVRIRFRNNYPVDPLCHARASRNTSAICVKSCDKLEGVCQTVGVLMA